MIAHRDELLTQAIEKFVLMGGNIEDTGIISNGVWQENKYTVASIQTLTRNLDKINGKRYDFVIVDEAHHTAAPTYMKVLNKLLSTNKKLKVLGVTATPFRTDRMSLKDFYKDLIYKIDYDELMIMGYLVPLKGYLIELPVEIDNAFKLARNEDGENDYTNKSISEVFNKDELNDLIVKRWIDLAKGKKTLFYLSSLEHALSLKEKFTEYGIRAEYIDGNIPLDDRRKILREFKEGKIDVITNMNVLTEGFDDPDVECIALVRPTKSLNLYTQIVGRGLRPSLDKNYCLVLDFTGISREYKMMGIANLFNTFIDRDSLKQGVSIGAIEIDTGKEKKRALKVLVGDKIEEFVFDGKEALNYFSKVDNNYVLNCGKNGKTVFMKEVTPDHYDIVMYEKGKGKQIVKQGLPKDIAIVTLISIWKEEKDEFMSSFPERSRVEKPTEKQVHLIQKYIDAGWIQNLNINRMSRLDATNIIGYIFANFPYIDSEALEPENVEPENWRQNIESIRNNLKEIKKHDHLAYKKIMEESGAEGARGFVAEGRMLLDLYLRQVFLEIGGKMSIDDKAFMQALLSKAREFELNYFCSLLPEDIYTSEVRPIILPFLIKYNDKYIIQNINYVLRHAEKGKNILGYLRVALRDNYARVTNGNNNNEVKEGKKDEVW